MKKRIISTLLALALVLSTFGGLTVRAAERNLALNRPAPPETASSGTATARTSPTKPKIPTPSR